MRLACRDLACYFGGVRAVDGITLEVAGGTCVALVGGNGSGKSTLLDLLSGVRAPTGGSVSIEGEPVPARPEAFAARGVRRTFQEPRLAAGLSVDENVALGLHTHLPRLAGIPFSRRARERSEIRRVREAVGLAVAGWRPVTRLSYGERKRVELARLLVSSPQVALLDEPLAGVATNERARLLAAVGALAAAGAAVIVVEHDLAVLEAVADRVVRLDRGRLAGERPAEAGSDAGSGLNEVRL